MNEELKCYKVEDDKSSECYYCEGDFDVLNKDPSGRNVCITCSTCVLMGCFEPRRYHKSKKFYYDFCYKHYSSNQLLYDRYTQYKNKMDLLKSRNKRYRKHISELYKKCFCSKDDTPVEVGITQYFFDSGLVNPEEYFDKNVKKLYINE